MMEEIQTPQQPPAPLGITPGAHPSGKPVCPADQIGTKGSIGELEWDTLMIRAAGSEGGADTTGTLEQEDKPLVLEETQPPSVHSQSPEPGPGQPPLEEDPGPGPPVGAQGTGRPLGGTPKPKPYREGLHTDPSTQKLFGSGNGKSSYGAGKLVRLTQECEVRPPYPVQKRRSVRLFQGKAPIKSFIWPKPPEAKCLAGLLMWLSEIFIMGIVDYTKRATLFTSAATSPWSALGKWCTDKSSYECLRLILCLR